MCNILNIQVTQQYSSNQLLVANRLPLFDVLKEQIQKFDFETLFNECLTHDVPIGKIRNLKEVFELPEAQHLLNTFKYQNNTINTVKSAVFKFH